MERKKKCKHIEKKNDRRKRSKRKEKSGHKIDFNLNQLYF